MKYTEGEWELEDGGISVGGTILAEVYGADDFPCLDEDDDVQAVAAECHGNGLLMAAAPDMYQALKQLLAEADRDRLEGWYLDLSSAGLDAARAAIAKAEQVAA